MGLKDLFSDLLDTADNIVSPVADIIRVPVKVVEKQTRTARETIEEVIENLIDTID